MSRSSLASNGRNGAQWTTSASGGRKEEVLQSARGHPGLRAQVRERPDATDPAVREQHEAVTDPLGVDQLMNGQNKGAPIARDLADHAHDLARLPEVEAVERLVHQQQGLRRDQRERQHEPAAIAFRQCADALAQNRRKAECADRFCGDPSGPAIGGREEFKQACHVLVFPGAHAVRQVEHELATLRQGRGVAAPEDVTAVRGHKARDRFQQGGLARAVGSDEAEHLAGIHGKRNVGEGTLFAVALGDAGNLHQRRGVARRMVEEARNRCDHRRLLPSADKHDEVHDMSLVVGCIHTQRDRDRAQGAVQDDMAG